MDLLEKYDAGEDIRPLISKMPLVEAVNMVVELQKEFYWKRKDLAAMVEVSTACVDAHATSPELSPVLYNLGSFTVPWWSDSIDADAVVAKAGLKASKQLVALRRGHGFPPEKVAGALWLYGAHELYTAQDYEGARDSFTEGLELGDAFLKGACTEGLGRTEVLLGDRQAGAGLLEEAVRLYREIEDEYNVGEVGEFLRSQEL